MVEVGKYLSVEFRHRAQMRSLLLYQELTIDTTSRLVDESKVHARRLDTTPSDAVSLSLSLALCLALPLSPFPPPPFPTTRSCLKTRREDPSFPSYSATSPCFFLARCSKVGQRDVPSLLQWTWTCTWPGHAGLTSRDLRVREEIVKGKGKEEEEAWGDLWVGMEHAVLQ